MAQDTAGATKKLVIYEVFVRNHSKLGTFAGVTADLPRLKELGVDIVWLMPIHPIGVTNRKGSAGSPYAIADYTAVNPHYGTEADLVELVNVAHQLGLKVMIDVVYNHTSPDSILARTHPEWFYHNDSGQPIPRHPDWFDIVDLKYGNPELSDYLIEAMLKWVKLGIDGFRCDVASVVPVEFWLRARQAVAEVKPDFIWLAESVHMQFVRNMRRLGYVAHADAELYQAFDITYDYDIHHVWQACVSGEMSLVDYVHMLELQEVIYPANFIKLRFVENHDQPRITAVADDLDQAKCWTAFSAFLPGAFLIYSGQETATRKSPTLFDPDPVAWPTGTPALTGFLSALATMKKSPALDGQFEILASGSHLQARWQNDDRQLYGIFNVRGVTGRVTVNLQDGDYTDLLTGKAHTVSRSQLTLMAGPIILTNEVGGSR
jgi:glycosidase